MDLTQLEEINGTESYGFRIVYIEECGSTNTLAMESAAENAADSVYIAGMQTAGKGRLGRKWDNEKGCSLTFSILKQTDIPVEKLPMLTPIAGMCVRDAIEKVCGVKCDIKWPNDILYEGRKICGILTEARADTRHVIVGIGINISARNWSGELRSKAASIEDISGKSVPCSELLQEILKSFRERCLVFGRAGGFGPLKADYEKHLINTGRPVSVYSAGGSFDGTAIGIDDEIRLLVKKADGTVEAVFQGDVSLRKI